MSDRRASAACLRFPDKARVWLLCDLGAPRGRESFVSDEISTSAGVEYHDSR